ncbi:hypothetical protein SAMN05216176_1121, partial [Nitratireductor indicus]
NAKPDFATPARTGDFIPGIRIVREVRNQILNVLIRHARLFGSTSKAIEFSYGLHGS